MSEIEISFKISGGTNFNLKLQPSATVAEVKQQAVESSGIPADQQRIIYKDEETLAQHGVQTGHTVHLVKGAAAGKPSDTPASTTASAPSAHPAASGAPANQVPAGFGAPGGFGAAAGGAGAGAMNPFGGNFLADPGMQAAMAQMAGLEGGGMPGGMGGGMPGGMDPAVMGSLMQTPVFQQMLSAMAQNPQMMAQMMQSNPMLQSMAQQNPQMAAMMQNPEMLRALLNPQTIQAVLQMQQAMATLQGGPGGAPAAAGRGRGGIAAQQPQTAPGGQSPPSAFPGQLGGMGAGVAPGGGAGRGQPDYQAMMAAMAANPMLAQMLAGGGAPGGAGAGQAMMMPQATAAELEARYTNEIRQLEGMGFIDRAANLEALRVCDGNVELAINYLFDLGSGN